MGLDLIGSTIRITALRSLLTFLSLLNNLRLLHTLENPRLHSDSESNNNKKIYQWPK